MKTPHSLSETKAVKTCKNVANFNGNSAGKKFLFWTQAMLFYSVHVAWIFFHKM